MSIRITELDAITSLQSGDYIAVDNESTGTHKFDALNIGANIGQNIANTYSSSASYAIGQYCLYDNNLYKCITTISTPEAWNSSHWIQVTVGEGLYEKVDKVSGKGLSTNDFTDEYKQKLGGIEAGAEVNVQANWAETNTSSDDYIKNKPGNATTEISGFMSASDKQKLDNIASGAEVNVQANWTETDSSKDDYIKNKPTIDDTLSTSSTNAVENSAIATAINNEATTRENADNALDGRIDTIEEILPNKANINGFYEEMTVGSAEQLISTESMEDSEPYIFRKSGNGADIGDRETDMLVGGTVTWNQLVGDSFMSGYWYTGGTSVSYADGIFEITATATGAQAAYRSFDTMPNHVYVVFCKAKCDTANARLGISLNQTTVNTNTLMSNKALASDWGTYSGVGKATSTGSDSKWFRFGIPSSTPLAVGDSAYIKDVMLIDLTLMLGTEIADYIYGLEQANAGDGVAWFKKYFPNSYYQYNAVSLQSVNVASHDMTGFNQWNEEWELGAYNPDNGAKKSNANAIRSKNYIPVIGSETYYFHNGGNTNTYVFCYDTDKNYLGLATSVADGGTQVKNRAFNLQDGTAFINFYTTSQTTYSDNICINISDANRNGEYEEYVIHSYPYDESVELRGVPQLIDEELKYDGDTYESSGKVTRKYGVYTFTGNETWSQYSGDVWYTMTLADADYTSDGRIVSDKFVGQSRGSGTAHSSPNDIWLQNTQYKRCYVVISGATTEADVQSATSGATIVYQLETSTEEEAEGFTNPQIVDASGTEEYVDAGVKNNTRDVAIPVGHITQYIVNLRDKLQHLPFLAKEDGDYFVNQTGTQMSLKKVEGYYEDLVVGVADNLSTDIRTNDQTPYLFRTSGGSVDIGDREYIDNIVGGTVVWNQLIASVRTTATLNDIVYTKVDASTLKIQGTASATSNDTIISAIARIPNHVYLKLLGANSTNDYWLEDNSRKSGDGAVTKYSTTGNVPFRLGYVSGAVIDITVKPQLFDLTQMFGTTIADYIYSLETANAGAGVAYFKKLFPKDYYAYNAGELLSVSGLQSHDMVGFNAFDKSTVVNGRLKQDGTIENVANYVVSDFIPVIPNQTYYLSSTQSSRLKFYDADKVATTSDWDGQNNGTFIVPNGVYYVRFTIYTSVINVDSVCFNLSWDGSRDGEYEPYQKWSYPLDSSLELRGIPKLDSNNNLYYNGDTYAPDGTVTRKYGIYTITGNEGWAYYSSQDYFYATVDMGAVRHGLGDLGNAVMSDYTEVGIFSASTPNKSFVLNSNAHSPNCFYIKDTSFGSDLNAFKSAVTGKQVVYKLATPTTESAEPYTNPQIVDDFGTEEYVIDSTINVPIPVGHDTDYPINLKSKLEMAPDSPDGDGDYIVRQTNGTNEYVPLIIEDQLPAVPSTDGTYTLTVTIASGEATYSWT